MSALKLDEFAQEMRDHYIATTIESLARFVSMGSFASDVKAALAEWCSEARSNEMLHFSSFLESLKVPIEAGALNSEETPVLLSKLIQEYLEVLKTQEDSLEYAAKYSEALKRVLGDGAQLYLQCVSGEHHFVVPVKHVIEIVGNKKVFPLPLQQTGVRGLMSFRGQGIPVINLNDFGFANRIDNNKKTYFVVCDFESSFFALEVHRTDDVVEFEASQFQSCSESDLLSPVVDRFVIRDQKSLMLLDIKKLVKHE